MVDISRGTTGVVLPRTISRDIWQGVQEASAVMALSNRIDLPGTGLTIDVITGDPTPAWTAETAEAPVSRGTFTYREMTPYSLEVIVPFSKKFRRDKKALYNALVGRLPGVMAAKIDNTVFLGTAPGSNFDVLTAATAVDIDNTGQATYDNLVDLELAIATQSAELVGGMLTGYALSPQAIALLRKVKDGSGLPLLGSLNGLGGDLLGVPYRRSMGVYSNPTDPTADVVGFAGDWRAAYVGVVEDITISLSDQATIQDGATSLNLWQRGMFAIKVEMELGFRVKGAGLFRRLSGATTAP